MDVFWIVYPMEMNLPHVDKTTSTKHLTEFYLVALIVFHFVNFIYYSKKILSLGIGLFLEYIMDNFIKKIDGKQ